MDEQLPTEQPSNNSYFQGTVIAKLGSVESLVHSIQLELVAQRAALADKIDRRAFDEHVKNEKEERDSLRKAFDDLSGKVMVIIGGVAVVSFLAQVALSHFWH